MFFSWSEKSVLLLVTASGRVSLQYNEIHFITKIKVAVPWVIFYKLVVFRVKKSSSITKI